MKRIQEVIKKKAKEYEERRVYVKCQTQHFLMVTVLLILLGIFVEFAYYSTIGQLGQKIAFEIVKVHVVKFGGIVGYAFLIDWLAAFLVGTLPRQLKEGLLFPLHRPTVLNTMLLILMFSLDAPISVFCVAITVVALFSQNTRHGYSYYTFHPVLIAYVVGVFGLMATQYNLGLTDISPSLTAPYRTTVYELHSSLTAFKQHYYSMTNVIFGLFEGGMSYTLIIPLCVSALFLMRRRVIEWRVVVVYFLGYILTGGLMGILIGQPLWLTVLFLLNGSIVLSGIFLLPDAVTFSRIVSFKYIYVVGAAVLSAVGCYFVHFVIAPYLVLLLLQGLVFLVGQMKRLG